MHSPSPAVFEPGEMDTDKSGIDKTHRWCKYPDINTDKDIDIDLLEYYWAIKKNEHLLFVNNMVRPRRYFSMWNETDGERKLLHISLISGI